MHAAFSYIDARRWTGGYNYLLNLIRILLRYESTRVTPILFTGTDVPDADLEPFAALSDLRLERDPAFNEDMKNRRLLQSLLFGLDYPAVRAFERAGVSVVFEVATFYGWRFPLPCVAWMADFQHRRVPDMFGRMACWKRDLGFRTQILAGRTVMLSSEGARTDFQRLYPTARSTVAIVPFAVMAEACISRENADRIRRQYELPEMFFYLPNQFWRHKNHELVIDALAMLKNRGISVVVAASGNPKDARFPGLYDELRCRVTQLGLDYQFRFLGLIPYPHVISLMAASAAVINPSFFEGWSTTVEEAKAIDARLILSDIPVHREQAPQAGFFDPRSAAALARQLEEIIAEVNIGTMRTIVNIARQPYEAEVRQYGQRLADLFERAASFRYAPSSRATSS
jgi:glycosyltransferase involved in cell wall biosynthesis